MTHRGRHWRYKQSIENAVKHLPVTLERMATEKLEPPGTGRRWRARFMRSSAQWSPSGVWVRTILDVTVEGKTLPLRDIVDRLMLQMIAS